MANYLIHFTDSIDSKCIIALTEQWLKIQSSSKDMNDQQTTQRLIIGEEQVNCNSFSLHSELLCTHVAKEMLDLSATSSSQSSHVTIVTLEPCVASLSHLDDVPYEHVSTNVDYDQYQNHNSLLANTVHLQYDSLQLTTSSTTSNQYTEPLNNRDVADESDQSVGNVATGQNGQSVASQRHAESAPTTVECLTVMLDDSSATATAYAQLLRNVFDLASVLN